MRRVELITKALFYFFLPALVVFSDNLQTMESWDWTPANTRKMLLIPLIVGLTNVKGFFSKTYAWFTSNELETRDLKNHRKG